MEAVGEGGQRCGRYEERRRRCAGAAAALAPYKDKRSTFGVLMLTWSDG